ncbi:MAG: SycD/LcrH family type III secretion system chaperone [Duodenibacillus sp.]|jgi:type III secretion system low calcium response chaperone LcrH/SycD|nr:SycD/LcrH family type III secretion system chaperone [Duodenibacillus sp.]
MAQEGSLLLSNEQLRQLIAGLMDGQTVARVTGVSDETLESMYALAHGLYTSGSHHDAQVVFQALCVYNPNDYRFWMGLAGSRQALEQYAAAIDAYQMAAVSTQLSTPEPFLFAARCLLKLGRKDDAVIAIKALLKLGDSADPRHTEIHNKAKALLALLEKED